MASQNLKETLFSTQTSDATGSAVELKPGKNNEARFYDLIVRGGFGGGTFSMTISYDGTNYVDLADELGNSVARTAAGGGTRIKVDRPLSIKGVLAGATDATLTAELFYPFKS